MPQLPKTLLASAASVLVLCQLGGAASAMPREDQTVGSRHTSEFRRVAHSGGEPAAAGTQPEYPERFVRIAAFNWSKAVSGLTIQANLTIESALPFALKEVEIACAQFARSGVEIDSNGRRIAEVVPARGRLQVKALDIGPIHPQAGSSGCRVVGVTPA